MPFKFLSFNNINLNGTNTSFQLYFLWPKNDIFTILTLKCFLSYIVSCTPIKTMKTTNPLIWKPHSNYTYLDKMPVEHK